MPSGWVFRIEVVSKDTSFTKDIKKVVQTKLLESPHIDKVLIEELYEAIKLFKKPKKKES